MVTLRLRLQAGVVPYVLKSPGQASLRKGRRSLPGQAYFLTFTTHRRKPLFAWWAPASTMSRLVADAAHWPNAQLLAWVLMPDHWHGLLVLDNVGDLAKSVGTAKGMTSLKFNRNTNGSGALWARGFHDRAIRRDDDLRAAARYLVANPLRAGLVDHVGDYPFWNAIWLNDEAPL